MTSVNGEFDFLYQERSEKPREKGLTMIEGDGPFAVAGMNYVQDVVDYAGQWFDLYKFQRGVFGLQRESLLVRKLALLEENDIITFPGGIPMEAAILDDNVTKYFESLQQVGFTGIEISATAADIGTEVRAELIEEASDEGLYVNAEMGKKATETGGESIDFEDHIEEIEILLNAGADMIIFEMEEIESSLVDGDEPNQGAVEALKEVIATVGEENIMFEVPFMPYFDIMETTGWLMNQFGRDINLGNVRPSHVLPLEQQRRGLGQYTFQRNRGL